MSRLAQVRIAHSATIGRELRLDSIETIGVSSQTLAEEAIAAGERGLASSLLRYYRQEMDIMNGIMHVWIQDTMRYIILKAGGTDASATTAAAGVMRAFRAYPFGLPEQEKALTALAEEREDEAVYWLERMHLAYLNVHDLQVAWMQDQLSFIASEYEEEAVLETVLHTHQDIWGDRYAAWDEMNALGEGLPDGGGYAWRSLQWRAPPRRRHRRRPGRPLYGRLRSLWQRRRDASWRPGNGT